MKAGKRKPRAARKRRKPAVDHHCFYGFTPAAGWQWANHVRTADQGAPEPAPYWSYEPSRERAGAISEAIPNVGGAP